VDVPLSLTNPIPHGNDLRTQFYGEQNIATSNGHNMTRVHNKLAYEWKGRMVRNVSDADRLWFQHASAERREADRKELGSDAEAWDERPSPSRARASREPESLWGRDHSSSPRLTAAAAHLRRQNEDSW
jgi:hypothetical protein